MDKNENADNILKFKREDPEQFHCLVKMHLSFLLDMNTDECDCSFLFDHIQPNDHATPKRKTSLLHNKGAVLNSSKKGIMEGAPLTMEGVCQIFQIIQFLDRSNNIEQIGLFRKTGNLQKQKVRFVKSKYPYYNSETSFIYIYIPITNTTTQYVS